MSKLLRNNFDDFHYDKLNLGRKKKSHKKQKNVSVIKPESYTWVKLSCSNQSLDASRLIANFLEDLLYKNTRRKAPIKAWNTYIDGEYLIFSIRLPKSDFDCIRKNYNKRDLYDLKINKFETVHIPAKFPSYWIDVIETVLTNRFKTNPETNETELDLSYFSEDKILLEHGLLLELSNPRVIEGILSRLITVLKELTYLNLSNNGIYNFYKLKSFLKSVNVSKLNLSENYVARFEELSCLEGSSVSHLNIAGNKIVIRKTFNELKEGLRKLIPKLQYLNNKDLGCEILIAGEPEQSRKELLKSIDAPKDTDAYAFVINFLSNFDKTNRDGLLEFYNTDSTFTMSTFGDSMSFYKANNFDLKISKNIDKKFEVVKRGKAQILGVLANFPLSKHVQETLNVEVNIEEPGYMIIHVTGVFIELPTNNSKFYRPRAFDRTLCVVQGGIILHDLITLFPNDVHLLNKYKPLMDQIKSNMEFVNSHKALENFSSEEIEMVKQFKSLTKLNVTTCINFLQNFHTKAFEEFQKYQSAGTIPPEAFVD